MRQFSAIFKIIAVERRKQESDRGKRDKEVITSNSTRMCLQCILALRKDRVALGCPHMHIQHRYHIIDRTINSTGEIIPLRVLGKKTSLTKVNGLLPLTFVNLRFHIRDHKTLGLKSVTISSRLGKKSQS